MGRSISLVMSNLTESNNIISKIWEKICNQQGRDPDANDPDETIQSSDEDEIDLPSPEVSKLTQIKECFNTQNRMMRREKLSAALKDNSYIPKVRSLFFYARITFQFFSQER